MTRRSQRSRAQQPKPKQPYERLKCEHLETVQWGADERYYYCANCGKRMASPAVAPRARVQFTRTRKGKQAPGEEQGLAQLDMFQLPEDQAPEDQASAAGEGQTHGE